MACTQTENFYFAIRKDTGEPVHISYFSQLPDEKKGKYRGLKCNCICAACKRSLVAKMGEVKAPHFAHYVEKGTILDCSAQKANESGLHQMAKEIVKESTYINLPAIEIEAEYDLSRNVNDEKQCEPLHIKDKQTWHFLSAEVEKTCKGFTPDVYLHGEKTDLLVEIMVTHPVGDEKKERVKQVGLPMIQIDISDIYNDLEGFSKETLRRELIDSVEHKHWIYNSLRKKGIEQLERRNRELQGELEAQIRKEQERRIKENEEEHVSKMWRDSVYYQLMNDKDFYRSCSEKLINDEQTLEEINNLGICDLKFSEVKEIPFYFNIPVFGEIVFNCDRRIWQGILFEKFIYRKNNTKIQVKTVCFYFLENYSDKLDLKLVGFSKGQFADDSFLQGVIQIYMIYLSKLGFIDNAFYEEQNADKEYPVMRPKSRQYAEYLKQALLEMPPTNQPFNYLKEGWEKSNLNCDKRKAF